MKFHSKSAFARALEQIDAVRSNLRWVSRLEHTDIQKILRQVNEMREDILFLSGVERYKQKLMEKMSHASVPLSRRRRALLKRGFIFEGVFGENPKILELLEISEKAARTDLPILIEGESGTGKELLARIIHTNSRRAGHPFVSVNCGAIPSALLESELFGHVKGSFTGAVKDRKGKFEAADRSTIFLDEIGELPPESQVKLLRVLESGEIQRVGSDETIRADARILAAGNRNLYQMTRNGQFREDLYYRLSVISVKLPPLRERRDELPMFIDYFCTQASKKLNRPKVNLSPRLRNFLTTYDYPGNIRELRNIIDRISCLSEDVADLKDLPDDIRRSLPDSKAPPISRKHLTLDKVRKAASDAAEKEFLETRLREVRGNVTALSKRLGMNRSYLQTLLKRRGIYPREFKIVNSEIVNS